MGAAKHTTTAKAQRALRKDIKHSSFDRELLGKDLVGGLYTCEGERSRRAGEKQGPWGLRVNGRSPSTSLGVRRSRGKLGGRGRGGLGVAKADFGADVNILGSCLAKAIGVEA